MHHKKFLRKFCTALLADVSHVDNWGRSASACFLVAWPMVSQSRSSPHHPGPDNTHSVECGQGPIIGGSEPPGVANIPQIQLGPGNHQGLAGKKSILFSFPGTLNFTSELPSSPPHSDYLKRVSGVIG